MKTYDVVVVGAGAAGVGIAAMLTDFGVDNMVVLERDRVGSSFDRWPKEMRFITPSFTTNYWGHLDLNSVATGLFQLIASTSWVASVFVYGSFTTGDYLQLIAASAWTISNLISCFKNYLIDVTFNICTNNIC